MADKHLVAVSVAAEDVDIAKKIIEDMCREQLGELIPGFSRDESLASKCSPDGAGEPTYHICFGEHTDFYINRWRELGYKFRIKDNCPSYFFDKIESEEEYLSTMNLKKI